MATLRPQAALSTTSLQRPPADLAKLLLKTRNVSVDRLYRVTRHSNGEPYFGQSGSNRFDSSDRSFGTCYLGFDALTAVAETVLHDESPVNGKFAVAKAYFWGRQLVRFEGGGCLRLVNLTGVQLKRIGAMDPSRPSCPMTCLKRGQMPCTRILSALTGSFTCLAI